MEKGSTERGFRWRKVAYGGMQAGFEDNHTDESFLEEMVTNANVVKRNMRRAVEESVSISHHLCVVSLVSLVWAHNLGEVPLLLLDAALLASGFVLLLLTGEIPSLRRLLNAAFFATGLAALAPVYHTLTRSISSDSVWAAAALLLLLHLYLHDYSGSSSAAAPTPAACVSLNAAVVASVFVASRLPTRLHVLGVLLFSLQVFLFAPWVSCSIRRRSRRVHVWVSVALMAATLCLVHRLQPLLSVALFGLLVFVNLVCPYWLIRMQEYKFEINGPWDEAKLCFHLTD